MIPDNQIVTKKFLEKELKGLKIEIIREVRVMMYETMESAMENMKVYYKVETERYIGALVQGYRDDLRVFQDEMRSLREKSNNHEDRIEVLEAKR